MGGAVYSDPKLQATGADGAQILVGEAARDLIGAPAYAADKVLVGKVRALVVTDSTKSPDVFLDTSYGVKSVGLGSISFTVDKTTGNARATTHLTRGEIEKLPSVSIFYPPRSQTPDSGASSRGPAAVPAPMPPGPSPGFRQRSAMHDILACAKGAGCGPVAQQDRAAVS